MWGRAVTTVTAEALEPRKPKKHLEDEWVNEWAAFPARSKGLTAIRLIARNQRSTNCSPLPKYRLSTAGSLEYTLQLK